MRGRAKMCTVKGGRIRLECSRCAKKQSLSVPAEITEKTVRCQCGLSTFVSFDRRTAPREAISRRGVIILPNGQQYPIYLCDRSSVGIGFNIPNQYDCSIAVGQDVLQIEYPSLSGTLIHRKIRIKNLSHGRVGGQLLDPLMNES